MTLPVVLLGLAIALLIGFLFHVLRGGSGSRLLLYLGMSILGFALGQWGSMAFGWRLFMFGVLDIGMGVIGSVLSLAIGDWLSRIESKKESSV
ncbi:MAG: hypothetical protein IH588_12900 [Anaerolineales bacterium]|nr:hypothetical protein [Anaerolineales bacterium]